MNALPWSGKDPDGTLVSKAKDGDKRAFDSLVRGYSDGLRGFVARRVSSDAVDDVVQDIWTACWIGVRQFTGRSRFKAWLYGVATNKCKDFYRGHAKSSAENLDELEELPDNADAYGLVDLRESVRTALSRLPENQREVVELYYYAGLTLPEIAANLKRNLNTVKYQFYRAHTQVELELKTEGVAQR